MSHHDGHEQIQELEAEVARFSKALASIIESGRKVRPDDSGTAYFAIGAILAEAGLALGIPLDDVFARPDALSEGKAGG